MSMIPRLLFSPHFINVNISFELSTFCPIVLRRECCAEVFNFEKTISQTNRVSGKETKRRGFMNRTIVRYLYKRGLIYKSHG